MKDIDFSKEKFIDAEIGELSMEYDKIRGMNVNVARISPDFIDGLKPVQRRALYIMFLKDGGKRPRKLATISGEVFGKAHPHSPTSIEDAIVNIAQEWHNSIPLIEGIGNFGSCHDDKTEVLTRGGWIPFNELTEKSMLATVDPETGELIYEAPTKLISYPYKGDLICLENHGMDFAVTPNHRMMIKPMINEEKWEYAEKFEFVNAEDLPAQSRVMAHAKQTRNDEPNLVWLKDAYGPEKVLSMEDWVHFVAAYLVHGSMSDDRQDPWIKFNGMFNLDQITYMEDVLEKIVDQPDIVYSNRGQEFTIKSDAIWDRLYSYGLYGEAIEERTIPPFVYGLDQKYLQHFYYALHKINANLATTPDATYLTSERLANALQHILLLAGSMSAITKIEVGDETLWQVRLFGWTEVGLLKRETHRVPYDGMVYCAEVPTYHTLVTRRNGKVLISGNCSGDVAGASRYIQAKLSDYCRACFFEDWKDSVVDMEMAYDEETMMPTYLPSKYPNVLLNGCLGIGYGMSSFMFCCNFKELVESTIMLMKHPNIPIVLIPESPTGASIVETDFAKLCNSGKGAYTQRCTYEIDAESNRITITSLPDQVSALEIREKIADIKEKGGLGELLAMNDLSGKKIQIELVIRDDVNPYRFMRKLIGEVPGLEKTYSVAITVINNYNAIDYSVKDLLLQWIQWRREQKRIVVSHKRTRLFAEQRENDVKIFIMEPKRLKRTIDIFTSSRNRKETEERLIQEYHNTEIRMDSLQARTLSQMYLSELNQESYEKCLKYREELRTQLEEIERELADPDGIDKLIIGELRDGIKRFGTPRKSNVVPKKIKISTDVEGACIMQLNANGMVTRKTATNIEADPIPSDSNGFAVYIQNDSSFILINELGHHSYVRAKDIPLDTEVPVARYMKKPLAGRIVAMLPVDMDMDYCCVLVSKMGQVKRFRISDIAPSKKPCIALDKGDTIVRGVVVRTNSKKDLLVYTHGGKGQRMSANDIRITSPTAKGVNGFKLKDDEISGLFAINPIDHQYLLYTTIRGKQRLNNIEFLIPRANKHEQMVSLIPLTDRDRLQSIVAVNKLDKVMVYFKDGVAELLDLSSIPESTMSTPPKKHLKKTVDSLSSQVIKVVVK